MYPYWAFNGRTYRSLSWLHPEFTHYIDYILDLAQAAHLNIIRPTNYMDNADTIDESVIWTNMDYLIAQAQARHIFVLLDLSTYRNFLKKHGTTDTFNTVNWAPLIHFVAQRYKNSAAVAMYSIAGEVPAPRTDIALASRYVRFYTDTENQLYREDEGHHLISAGGLSYLNHPGYGVPWQAIYSLPHNSVAAIHVYGSGDRNVSVPLVSDWAITNRRMFMIEEFAFSQRLGDAVRAADFADIYSWGRQHNARGIVFWNLGPEIAPGSGEVSPQTPLTWAVVQQHAPAVTPTRILTATPTTTPMATTAPSLAPISRVEKPHDSVFCRGLNRPGQDPMAAEVTLSTRGSGMFLAYVIGRSADNRIALELSGQPAPKGLSQMFGLSTPRWPIFRKRRHDSIRSDLAPWQRQC